MKKKNNKKIKLFLSVILAISLMLPLATGVYAEEQIADEYVQGGNYSENIVDIPPVGGEFEQNIFEDIYSVVEENADKIFSILAFIGTLIVSVGYKSGLLPLLNDALSKLRGAIESVKENGERNNASTTEKIDEIAEAVRTVERELSLIEGKVKDYDLLHRERETVKLLLEEQINMLYTIFLSSSLPQYQKDEIGLRIQSMREELASYEKSAE